MIWPFKKSKAAEKETPFYRITESVSGEFWVESLMPGFTGKIFHQKISQNFLKREEAQKYIDDRTPKEGQHDR